MWKNIAESDRPQTTMWRTRIAWWILKSTVTHSECVILIASPIHLLPTHHGLCMHRNVSIVVHSATPVIFAEGFIFDCLLSIRHHSLNVHTMWQSCRSVLILNTSSSRRNSSVRIVTRLRAGWLRYLGSNSGGTKYVSHFQWPDVLWVHLVSDGYCGGGAVCTGINKRGHEAAPSSIFVILHCLDNFTFWTHHTGFYELQ
jgi:hypothetical protein